MRGRVKLVPVSVVGGRRNHPKNCKCNTGHADQNNYETPPTRLFLPRTGLEEMGGLTGLPCDRPSNALTGGEGPRG